MKNVVLQLKWQLIILHKNNLTLMITVIALAYSFAVYFLKDIPGSEKLVVLFIFTEPASIGFFFVGLSLIIERDQRVLSALLVTPVSHTLFLTMRLLVLSLFSTVCATGMVLPVIPGSVQWLHFVSGVFIVSAVFGIFGVLIVSYSTDVLHFIIRSIPVLLVLSLPLLNFFGLTEFAGFSLLPVQGSLILIEHSLTGSRSVIELAVGYLVSLAWIIVIYAAVFRVFGRRLANDYV